MQHTCPHGERIMRTGTSAKGPWTGYFCPLKKGDPEQCPPKFDSGAKQSAPANASTSGANQVLREILEELQVIRELLAKQGTVTMPPAVSLSAKEEKVPGSLEKHYVDSISPDEIPF